MRIQKIETYMPLVLMLVLGVLSLTGCNKGNPMRDYEQLDLVWISDSSGWGVADVYAAMVEEDLGIPVVVHDNWIGGLSAGTVLSALKGESTPNLQLRKLADQLAEAEIVVFYANPEESLNENFPMDFNCTNSASQTFVAACEPEVFSVYVQHLEEIYQTIIDLRMDQPTIIRAYDAYNPILARWQADGVFADCQNCWANYNAAIHQAAESYGIPIAEVALAWNGPNRDEDPNDKDYTKDGIHPNELGAEVIAEAIRGLGYEPTIP